MGEGYESESSLVLGWKQETPSVILVWSVMIMLEAKSRAVNPAEGIYLMGLWPVLIHFVGRWFKNRHQSLQCIVSITCVSVDTMWLSHTHQCYKQRKKWALWGVFLALIDAFCFFPKLLVFNSRKKTARLLHVDCSHVRWVEALLEAVWCFCWVGASGSSEQCILLRAHKVKRTSESPFMKGEVFCFGADKYWQIAI